MAIFKNSTFGNIRKSIGDDVAYRMGGQNIVRKKPVSVKDANSLAQQQRRNALTEIVKVFRNNSRVIKMGFLETIAKHSAYNAFSSTNLKNAVDFDNENASVNFEKLLVAKGTLPVPVVANFASAEASKITMTVTNQKDDNQLFDEDKIVFVFISESGKSVPHVIERKLSQNMPTALTAQGFETGDTLKVYAFHYANNGAKASDSVYLGSLTA
ncbi:DUF6266 family protein [Capnocytophaga canis]|uniref:DUF6266 family protein n=1 Tax=Capnocytophaga canis TaxID=1848903 RepID=UPI001562C702|nr:DUF6266 family protein [Capnocytophaga canis]